MYDFNVIMSLKNALVFSFLIYVKKEKKVIKWYDFCNKFNNSTEMNIAKPLSWCTIIEG